MKRKLLIGSVMLSLLLFAGFAFAQKPQPQWEYKFLYEASEKKSNELGSQGWELVAIQSTGPGLANNVPTYVFKRQK